MSDPVYYLEYRGTLAPDAPGGDKRTFDAWGINAADSISSANWDRGEGIFSTRADAPLLTEITWAAEDHIVIWRDSARIWHGYLISPADVEDAAGRTIRLRFADAWYWLGRAPAGVPTVSAQTTEQVTYTDSQGTPYTVGVVTSVTWSTSLGSVVWSGAERVRAQAPYTASGQVYRALYSAADFYAGRAGGCPFGIGTISLTNRAPTQDLKNLTCAASMQSAARYAVLSAGWWDQSGTQPIFHAADRAAITASTYALAPADQTHDVEPLTELQVRGVVINYWYGDAPGEYITDSAGDTSAGSGLLSIDSDVDDYQAAVVADTAGVAAILYAALSPLAWRGTLAVSEVDGTLPALRPGYALHLSGGETAWAAMGGVIQGTTLAIPAEVPAILTVGWGAPRQLNVTDWLDISRIGTGAAGSSARVDNDATPPDPAEPTPGTYDDLNGGTGAAPTAGATLHTQAQGGTCRISGCLPLDGVETYRRWRTQTASGTLHVYWWVGNTVCAYDPTWHNSWALSGTCLWTANDDTTVANTMQYVDEASAAHAITTYGVAALPGDRHSENIGTHTLTPTESKYVGGGNCYPDNGTPAASSRATGIEAYTLSNEDTEDTAWTRMLALTSPSWATSETGTYSARTALTYLRQRYRYGYGSLDGDTIVATSGWTPWGVYEVKVQLQTHPVTAAGALTGDGSWTDLAQRAHLIQGDIDGKAKLDWQEEEPPRGYALRAVLVSVAPITS